MKGLEIALDGQRLNDLDSRVLTLDVRMSPETRLTAYLPGGGHGMRGAGVKRTSLTVSVLFELHEQDLLQRQALVDRVMAWCGGRQLTLNTLPGRRLRVICTALPMPSALRWTEPLTAVFTAYEVPFWEEEQPSRASGDGAALHLLLDLPGNADTVLEAQAENRSGQACSMLTMQCGGEMLCFEALGLAPGETLRITHDEAGRLCLTITGAAGTRSAYASRMASAADEVTLHPGRNDVACTADVPLHWQAMARGRWL